MTFMCINVYNSHVFTPCNTVYSNTFNTHYFNASFREQPNSGNGVKVSVYYILYFYTCRKNNLLDCKTNNTACCYYIIIQF